MATFSAASTAATNSFRVTMSLLSLLQEQVIKEQGSELGSLHLPVDDAEKACLQHLHDRCSRVWLQREGPAEQLVLL